MGRTRTNEPSSGRVTSRTSSERDVAVLPAAYAVGLDRVVDRAGDRAAGARRLDDLVDDADLLRLVDAAGEPLVLGGQLGLDLGPDLRRDLGQLAPVQDPDRGHRPHHRDLGARPGEHLGRAEGAGVHRDVGAAVGLAGDQGDPRDDALAERVQQLRAAAYDAVPLLADAGQVARHVDEHDQGYAERVAQAHEAGGLLRRQRVEAAAEPERVVGDHADRAAAEAAERGDDVGRPALVQLLHGALVEQRRRPAGARRRRASWTRAAPARGRGPRPRRRRGRPGRRAARRRSAPARGPRPRSR